MSKVESLLKQHNKDAVRDFSFVGVMDNSPVRLPTGIFQADLALGGGIPMGRISVIYGTEASMKTTFCLKLIAQAQKLYPDKTAVFIDLEGHFDTDWAKKLGVNCETLGYSLPDSAEQMIDVVESLMYADDLSIIVVDSLAAMVTQHELGKSAEDAIVGRSGLAINKFYRKVSRALGVAKMEGKNPTLVCVNQIRYKIGTIYGDPETMPGGPSFKFASSMTIRLYGKDKIVKEIHPALPAYKEVSMIVKKYKVPIVARQADFTIAVQPIAKYGLEVGDVYDWNTILAYMKELGLIEKDQTGAGGWNVILLDTGEQINYSTQEEFKQAIYDDVDLGSRVRKMIIEQVLLSV